MKTDATSPPDPCAGGCEKNQTLGMNVGHDKDVGHDQDVGYDKDFDRMNQTLDMNCTSHNSSSEEDLKCSGEGLLRATLLFGMCLTMTVILVGGIGNGITILILIHQMILGQRQQQIRTKASSVLVLNLAIADLCYSVLCLPFVFAIYLIIFRSGLDLEAPLSHGFDTKCQFSAFFRYTNAISEWTTIGLMALERFITISRYARWQKGGYRWFTPKKSACYCLMIWIVGVGLQLPTLLEDLEAPLSHGFDTKCQFSAFFRYTNAISEWTTIGLMALERFITISRYARWQKGGYRWFTPKKSACYCLLIWIVGVGLQLPTLLEAGPFFGKFGYNTDTVKCDFVSDQPENFGMRDVFFLMEAPVSCVLILVGYSASIVRIKSRAKFMRQFGVLCLPFVFSIYLIIFRSGLDLEAPLSHGSETNICQFSAFFRYTSAISEWTTIGLMALERFITISRYARWQKGGYRWFTPKKSACYCLLIWILSICMQMPTLLEVGAFFGKFGYNVDTIKCDFVSSEGQSFGMRDFFFLMEAPIPCALILVGYIAIIVRIKSSTRFMKKFGTSESRMKIAMRNSKTTGMCFRLIIVYLVCVGTVCVWNVAVPEEELGKPCNQIIGIYIYCFYWIQYAANNFIYAQSMPRYSKAAKQLLHALTPCYFRPHEHNINLNKADKRELVVSVISVERCDEKRSVIEISLPAQSCDAVTSDSEFSSNFFISHLFHTHTRHDICVNESRVFTGIPDNEATQHSYVLSCQLRPKRSVYSEWSFTSDRSVRGPGNDYLFLTSPSRKRSFSDCEQRDHSSKKVQRTLSC
ncbi:uncharacterized protein LOC125179474 [Hyalella azteca]|uniref:Uncharacterized protein LOC125179474 n=1 Tax=Hyalella azteca TaxID=294128 RepID=A0A979FW16_HYAAZ|nr:uncharacterized protein LOC125179474 [Hyalella azteca]